MRLSTAFCRLPIHFDLVALRREVAALPAEAWAPHPNNVAGNSSLRLISVGGGENDLVDGEMRPTPWLERSPYLRQLLASLGVAWSRSRLLRLAPGADVPQHADINYHWHYRVRLHIPIITDPRVRFHCDGESVHMAEGECWIFDNWRQHHVENRSDIERIHLVADTSGSAAFWELVARAATPALAPTQHRFDPQLEAWPVTERTSLAAVMPPAEVELLVLDLRAELVSISGDQAGQLRLAAYHAVLDGFCRDWRQYYAVHGAAPAAWPLFADRRERLREQAAEIGADIVIGSNRVVANNVLEGRILRSVCPAVPDVATGTTLRRRPLPALPPPLRMPLFIVAAPRSGSTLLFETLAASEQLCTVGGEGHLLFESVPELQLGAPGVDSNRFTATLVTDPVIDAVHANVLAGLVDAQGRRVEAGAALRFLEKTPKNALRVPFLAKLFPAAQFVFLWRDPRESIASIMEAWSSGRWRTYNGLPGFEGPWSLLLPPGWQSMQGRRLEQIAAFQWRAANETLLADLGALQRQRWTALSYAEFINDPARSTERLCRFAGIRFDAGLQRQLTGALPLSRQTNTPPAPDKWRAHETEIETVLPNLQSIWQQLRQLGPMS